MGNGRRAGFFAIARKNCANYGSTGPNSMLDYCYPGPNPCVLKDGKFCAYFDRAVIGYKPFRDAGLQLKWQDYWRQQKTVEMDRQAGLVVKPGVSGLVCHCGKAFVPTGRRQRQCPECRLQTEAEQKKLAVRKLRQRKRSHARLCCNNLWPGKPVFMRVSEGDF